MKPAVNRQLLKHLDSISDAIAQGQRNLVFGDRVLPTVVRHRSAANAHGLDLLPVKAGVFPKTEPFPDIATANGQATGEGTEVRRSLA